MNSFSLESLDRNNLDKAKTEAEKSLLEKQKDRREAAKKLFLDAIESWRDVRQQALDDLKFYKGDQWNASLLQLGKLKKEPALNANRLPTMVKQVENRLRQMDVTIAVFPTDEAGSNDTSKIMDGIIRNIQNDSQASSHYIQAAGENGALVPGIGYVKVELDYVNESSLDQKIMITSVFDPFTIVPDPSAVKSTFADGNFWFEVMDYSKAEYKEEFPKSTLATADLTAPGISLFSWATLDKGIRVVKYWYKEKIDAVLYELEDGTTVNTMRYVSPEIDPNDDTESTGKLPFPKDEDGHNKIISRKRHTIHTKIKYMVFNGAEILEEGDWTGCYFPIVAITGPQGMVDGKRDIRGIIRYAKDSQKLINYIASSTARRLGAANKAPWIYAKEAVAPYQKIWDSANTVAVAGLPYDAWSKTLKDANGTPMMNPKPERADQMGQITDLLQAGQKLENDLKDCIGIQDQSGSGKTADQEQSGVAIKTLEEQGNNANFHFSDNMVSMIEQIGWVLIDLIPKIYSNARVLRIVNADTTEEVVRINQIFTMNGQPKNYDLSKGEYGIKVNAGPAYATRKQASIEQLLSLCKIDPQLTPVLQHLIVGDMDFDGAKAARDILTKLFATNYPNLVDNAGGLPDLPPQAQAEMSQAHQAIQHLTQELQTLQQEYEKDELIIKTDKVKADAQMAQLKQEGVQAMDLERMRAVRDAEAAQEKMALEEVKMRIGHIEEMHKILMPHMVAGLPKRAEGGEVEAGQPTLVGEKGPEIIVPTSNGTVIPNDKVESAMDKLHNYAKDKPKGGKSPMDVADSEE